MFFICLIESFRFIIISWLYLFHYLIDLLITSSHLFRFPFLFYFILFYFRPLIKHILLNSLFYSLIVFNNFRAHFSLNHCINFVMRIIIIRMKAICIYNMYANVLVVDFVCMYVCVCVYYVVVFMCPCRNMFLRVFC